MSCSLIILVIIFQVISASTLQYKWEVELKNITLASNQSVIVPEATWIMFPSRYVTTEPVLRDYLIFKVAMDSQYFNYCERYSQNSWNMSCTELFCGTGSTVIQNPFYRKQEDNSKVPLLDVLHFANYCQYCHRPDFDLYHQLLSENKCNTSIQFPDISHCGGSTDHLKHSNSGSDSISKYSMVPNNYAMIYPPLFDSGYTGLICYCGSWDKYGYLCDAMTVFYIDFIYDYKPMAFCIIIPLILIDFCITIYIPECVRNILIYRKLRRDERRKWINIQTYFFSIRQQCIFFCLMALISLFVEQISLLLRTSEIFSFLRFFFVQGGFRMASFIFTTLSYTTLLILWAGLCNRELHAKYEIKTKFRAVLYIIDIILPAFVLISSLIGIFIQPPTISWIIFTSVVLFYVIFFPIGFTAYGVHMFFILKKCKDIKIMEFTFTRFILICNSILLVLIFIGVLVLTGFIIGWDWAGEFMGISRNLILDTVNITALYAIARLGIQHDVVLESTYGLRVTKIIKILTCVYCFPDKDTI